MAVVQSSAWCATCRRQTLHTKERINHVLHLILSVLTAGIWALFVWLPLGMKNSASRTRCSVCGSKPGLATVKHDVREAFGASDDPPPSTWLPPGATEPRD